jgi:hypothetical protein
MAVEGSEADRFRPWAYLGQLLISLLIYEGPRLSQVSSPRSGKSGSGQKAAGNRTADEPEWTTQASEGQPDPGGRVERDVRLAGLSQPALTLLAAYKEHGKLSNGYARKLAGFNSKRHSRAQEELAHCLTQPR